MTSLALLNNPNFGNGVIDSIIFTQKYNKVKNKTLPNIIESLQNIIKNFTVLLSEDEKDKKNVIVPSNNILSKSIQRETNKEENVVSSQDGSQSESLLQKTFVGKLFATGATIATVGSLAYANRDLIASTIFPPKESKKIDGGQASKVVSAKSDKQDTQIEQINESILKKVDNNLNNKDQTNASSPQFEQSQDLASTIKKVTLNLLKLTPVGLAAMGAYNSFEQVSNSFGQQGYNDIPPAVGGNAASKQAMDSFGQQGYNDIPPAVGGNAASKQAMDFFVSKGWTKEQAAGIVGNLQVESGNFAKDVIAGKRRGDGGKAVGIAQWHSDRQNIFSNTFKRPLAGSSLEQQLEFVNYELNNNEKKAGNRLRKASTPEEAASIVDSMYERSSGQHRKQRVSNAIALFKNLNPADSSGKDSPTITVTVPKAVPNTNYVGKQLPVTWNVPTNNQNAKVTGSAALGNIMQYITLENTRVRMEGIHPGMMFRFKAMAWEYNQRTGKKIQVNSAFRTFEDQVRMVKIYGRGRAAAPGTSRHELGLAIDISSKHGNELAKLGLLSKYGFNRPVKGEPWHLEPVEGKNIRRYSPTEEGSDSSTNSIVRSNTTNNLVDSSRNVSTSKKQVNMAWNKALSNPSAGRAIIQQPQPKQSHPKSSSVANPKQQYRRHFAR